MGEDVQDVLHINLSPLVVTSSNGVPWHSGRLNGVEGMLARNAVITVV